MAIALARMTSNEFSTSRLSARPIRSPPSCLTTSSGEMLYKPGRLTDEACRPWIMQLQTAMPIGPSSWTCSLTQNCSSSRVDMHSTRLALQEIF